VLPQVEYLGHLRGVKEKVREIVEAPAPQNVSQLKSYLGILILPNLSTILAPLYSLLQKKK